MNRRLWANALAVSASGVVGAIGTRPRSRWYRTLDKPAWNPPDVIFAPVWTGLYALIAHSSSRAQERAATRARTRRRWSGRWR